MVSTELSAIPAWTAEERESFFAAIERHRRAAWRVTLASALANSLVAVVVALLMSPIFYATVALLLDLGNLIIPLPNIVEPIGKLIGPAFDKPESVSLGRWIDIGVLAALPGFIWMAWVLLMIRRAARLSGMFTGADLPAQPPNPQVLAGQRFNNVIGEMSVAANIPAPRVLVGDWGGANAAVFGSDEQHATIVVSRELLAALNRDQAQGVAAHLIGSIANGDMSIGMRVAMTLGLFGLVGRMASAFTEGPQLRRLARVFMAILFRPTPEAGRAFIGEIADPFPDSGSRASGARPRKPNDWRTFAWMPFAGPVCMTGFFGGVINLFVLEPLVSLAWRKRKYMADATAVRLTRDPDTLAGALRHLADSGGGRLFGGMAAHLCVVRPGARADGLMRSSVVPSYPSVDRRLRELVKMGAHVTGRPKARLPALAIAIIVPLAMLVMALVGVMLCLMVWLSMALSMLFLGLPFGILHVFLRWIGHG